MPYERSWQLLLDVVCCTLISITVGVSPWMEETVLCTQRRQQHSTLSVSSCTESATLLSRIGGRTPLMWHLPHSSHAALATHLSCNDGCNPLAWL